MTITRSTETVLEKPVSVRARVRQPAVVAQTKIDAAPVADQTIGSNSSNVEEELKTLTLEWLEANAAANAAISAQKKLFKALGVYFDKHEMAQTTVDFGGKTYDVGNLAVLESFVNLEALRKLVTDDQIMEEVKLSQDAVKNIGGQNLLNKVLDERTKDPEFKVKAR